MIIFYADKGFELNLTGTSITLVEENDMFHNYFVKDYSLPFVTNIEKFTDEQIRFLHLDNIALSNAHYSGKLFVDNKFHEGYLKIISVLGKKIKGIVYHGSTTIPLLATKLADLPFSIEKTGSLKALAEATILQQYPDVGFNFPMIIDEEFNNETNYDNFLGIINNYTNNAFLLNYTAIENNETVIYNQNVLTPFPYLMEIIRVGFEAAGLLLNGDFINDKVNEKLIWDTSKFIEAFSTLSQDSHIFIDPSDEYVENNEIISEFTHSFNAAITGTYKLKMFLNLPGTVTVKSFKIYHLGKEVYSNANNVINEEIEINVSDVSMFGPVLIELKTLQVDFSINDYNKFELETSANKLNVYPGTFSLSQIMPDITFGTFLNKIKIFFNLKIVITDNIARFDYIDKKLIETQFKNNTQYEISEPLKEPSSIKTYKLQYSENDFMYVDASGQIYNSTDYSNAEIGTTDLALRVLPISEFNGVFTAKRSSDDPDFKILLYDGLQTVNNIPSTVETVQGRNFKLPEIYSLYYSRWIRFLLNAITFTDKFECSALEDFDVNEGQQKYNQKLIFEKISKTRVTEDTWSVTSVSKSLL